MTVLLRDLHKGDIKLRHLSDVELERLNEHLYGMKPDGVVVPNSLSMLEYRIQMRKEIAVERSYRAEDEIPL